MSSLSLALPSSASRARATTLPRTTAVFVAVGLLVVVAAGALLHVGDEAEPSSAPRPAAARAAARTASPGTSHDPATPHLVGERLYFDVQHLDLEVELPLGWHYAAGHDGARPGPFGTQLRTAMLFDGASGAEATRALLLGTTPLPPRLAERLPLDDGLLLTIVQFVEYQIAAKVQAHGIYRPGSCELVRDLLERRAGVCAGQAMGLNATSSVLTYVRLEPARAVVAMFVADESVSDPRAAADGIVGSLR